ncbi:MAG: discoidin domain-containing protein [Nitrospinota bacterium]|nr:discoidin domain-containing protein [Nitrospinota bacterium]
MAYDIDFLIGGTATASSTNGSNTPSKGFDDDTGTKWQASATTSPQWIKYQLATAKRGEKLRLRPDYSTGGSVLLIKNFKLYGSNDDSVWDNLLTEATSTNADQWFEYAFSNSTAYLYYKLEIIDHWYTPFSAYFTGIKEMELMERLYLVKSTIPRYDVLQPMTKTASSRYSNLQRSVKNFSNIYSNFQTIQKYLLASYRLLVPEVEIYTSSGVKIDTLYFGLLKSGEMSAEMTLYLWNRKSGTAEVLEMKDVYLSLALTDGEYSGGSLPNGQEMVDEKWLEVKSSGVSGTGITDDAHSFFAPVGGEPVSEGRRIGNIPPGAARHIQMRLNVPSAVDTPFSVFPKLVVSHRPANAGGFGHYFGHRHGKGTDSGASYG